MSPRPPTAQPPDPEWSADDFDWPPKADDLSIYDVEVDSWRGLQEASIEVFAARHGEVPRPRPQEARQTAQRLAGVLTAAALVAASAGWTLYRVAMAPLPVEAGDRPPVATALAPAAGAPTESPIARTPGATIIATYPVEQADAPSADLESPSTLAPAVPLEPEPAVLTTLADTSAVPVVDVLPVAVAAPMASAPEGDALVAASVAAARPVAAPRYTPDASIRQLLQRYEDAYDHRDVQTAATLWPSLDQRALTRAFASLDRQDVSFDRCDIDASEERGSAVCVGTVRYVPSVGRGTEKEGRITWTFDLTRSGEDWRIAGLRAR
jgi:hypothetical protein